VLSTLYHLSRFFAQNSEFDGFKPEKHTLEWARRGKQLKSPDLWLLSRLQQTVETYSAKLKTCEFNVALAALEDAVIEDLSRLYVPMVRKELWTDDPETLNRRLAVYATLWYALKTITLLFNPVTPYLSEALYQKVYRKLDPKLSESVNLEDWPKPSDTLRNKTIEEEFRVLFRTVSLVYAARQEAKLKRRWPLGKMVVVAPEETCATLKRVEGLFLELSNVKATDCASRAPEYTATEGWSSVSEGDTQVFLSTYRDDRLLGEGLMRDLARRVQALRKESGYAPTDVLNAVYISELDDESIRLLQPYLEEMKELVRARNVNLYISRSEAKTEWHESQLDEKKVYISIPTKA
jgi:valyl-tRNA synthetase